MPARRLLGYLVAFPESTSRAAIAERLWPDLFPPAPRNNLRNALSDIGQCLVHGGVSEAVFLTGRDSLEFGPDVESDLNGFKEFASRKDLESAHRAVRLYHGAFLPGVNDDWAEQTRREAEGCYRNALRNATFCAEEASLTQEALSYARKWIVADPFSNESHRATMRLLAAAGEGPEAMLTYQKFADYLREEMSVSPDRATNELYQEILAQCTPLDSVSTRSLLTRQYSPYNDPGLNAYVRRILDEFYSHAHHRAMRTQHIEPTLRADLAQEYQPLPIAELNRSHVDPDAERLLLDPAMTGGPAAFVVLGDYGAGKTSLLWKLAVRLAEGYITNPLEAPFPVLLSLHHAGPIHHGWELVRRLLSRQNLGDSAFQSLRELMARGRVVFLLDGFDELGRGLTPQEHLLSWRNLQSLVESTCRMILTSRSSFLHGSKHLADGLMSGDHGVLEAFSSSAVPSKIFELRGWDVSHVHSRLAQAWGSNWRHFWNRLAKMHPRLPGLVARPGFLQMTIETRHLLENATELQLVDLFAAHAELWYRDDEPRSYLDRETKRSLVETLARRVWVDNIDLIDEGLLRSALQPILGGNPSDADLRACEEDIAVCTQLEWFHHGYRFVSDLHLGYAIARSLAPDLQARTFSVFSSRQLTAETAIFLSQLTRGSEPALRIDRDDLLEIARSTATSSQADSPGSHLGGNALSVLAIRGDSLAGVELEGARLTGARLAGARLERAVLRGADLTGSVLDSAVLDGAKLDRANLTGVSFREASRFGQIRIGPRGDVFATGDNYGVLRLWDFQEGRRTAAVDAHADEIWALAWNPTRPDLLASGSLDCMVRFWHRHGQRLEPAAVEAVGHDDWVLCVSWSADGRSLAVGCADGNVVLHDFASGQRTALLACEEEVHCVAWHPTESLVAIASGASNIAIWRPGDGRPVVWLEGHSMAVWHVAWSPDGTRLVSTSDDGTVRLWSRDRWAQAPEHCGIHAGPAFSAAWQPNGRMVATTGADNVLRFWSVPELEAAGSLAGHTAETWNLAWHPFDSILLTASEDATIRYCHTERREWLQSVLQSPRCAGADFRGASGIDPSTRKYLESGGARFEA